MWPDRVSNPGPLAHESDALPTALRGPVQTVETLIRRSILRRLVLHYLPMSPFWDSRHKLVVIQLAYNQNKLL